MKEDKLVQTENGPAWICEGGCEICSVDRNVPHGTKFEPCEEGERHE